LAAPQYHRGRVSTALSESKGRSLDSAAANLKKAIAAEMLELENSRH
jgi:hypothetical protein